MSSTQHIDAVTRIPASHLLARPPAPRSVKIEISPRCNYRCAFCALHLRKEQPKHDIDFALFQRATREMREAGVHEIGLFYLGESTMNPELLVACLKHVKALGFPYVFLTSNASLADPVLVEQLMLAGLDTLKWSCNCADAEQFAEVVGVSAKYFERAKTNIRAAWGLRQLLYAPTRLYASNIRYDGAQQTKMEAFLDEHVRPFVDEHYWLPLYSMGSLATQRGAELGYRPTAGNQGRLGALREPLPGGDRTWALAPARAGLCSRHRRGPHARVASAACRSRSPSRSIHSVLGNDPGPEAGTNPERASCTVSRSTIGSRPNCLAPGATTSP